MVPDSLRQFYVYVIRDPRPGKNNEPIYVGKGKGVRAWTHWHQIDGHYNSILKRVLRKIREANLTPQIEFAGLFEVETEAFRLEVELIARYGRRNLRQGTLCNLTNGGDGVSGCLASIEATRRRNADPAFKAAIRKRNLDPAFQAKVKAAYDANPELGKARAEQLRKNRASPAVKVATSAQARKMNADPAIMKRRKAGIAAYWTARRSAPDYETARANNKAKSAAARQARYRAKHRVSPDAKAANIRNAAERMRKYNATPEHSARTRKMNADPAHQAKALAGISAYWDRLRADPEAYAAAMATRNARRRGRIMTQF